MRHFAFGHIGIHILAVGIDKNTGEALGDNQVFSNKLKEGKYDFTIDVNQPSATAKQYNLLLGMEIFKVVQDPRLIQLLINLTDFPYKEEWIQTLTQSMEQGLPGGQADPSGLINALEGGLSGVE